jgi:hypothetical protein
MQRRVQKLTQCNCSICRRYGALWAYQQRKALTIRSARASLRSYAWGRKQYEFFHCAICGCVTHYEQEEKQPDGSDMAAVNMRNVADPASIADLPIRLLDGDGSWKVLRSEAQPSLLISPSKPAGAHHSQQVKAWRGRQASALNS